METVVPYRIKRAISDSQYWYIAQQWNEERKRYECIGECYFYSSEAERQLAFAAAQVWLKFRISQLASPQAINLDGQGNEIAGVVER